MTEKPRGLSRSEASFREELVVRQADGAGDAKFGLHAFHQPGEEDGGG